MDDDESIICCLYLRKTPSLNQKTVQMVKVYRWEFKLRRKKKIFPQTFSHPVFLHRLYVCFDTIIYFIWIIFSIKWRTKPVKILQYIIVFVSNKTDTHQSSYEYSNEMKHVYNPIKQQQTYKHRYCGSFSMQRYT